jgi:hypothetical protein
MGPMRPQTHPGYAFVCYERQGYLYYFTQFYRLYLCRTSSAALDPIEQLESQNKLHVLNIGEQKIPNLQTNSQILL